MNICVTHRMIDSGKVADDANNSRYSTPSDQSNVTDKCRLEKESAELRRKLHQCTCIFTRYKQSARDVNYSPWGESERAVSEILARPLNLTINKCALNDHYY